jgi:AbrB family looped-hinge helix DNA binding protein
MDMVTISSKFQVVIPRAIREKFHLQPGQKLLFVSYKDSLRVIIVPPIEEGYGFLPGIDTDVQREEDDRV